MSVVPPPSAAPGTVDHDQVTDVRSWAWLYVRVSGILLVAFAGLFFADRYLLHDIDDATALTLATRWTNVWWRFADFAFVALATTHALVGLHWAAVRRFGDRPFRVGLEGVVAAIIGVLGLLAAWTILTF